VIRILFSICLFIFVWCTCTIVVALIGGLFFQHLDEFSGLIGLIFGALIGLPAGFLAIGLTWRD
jgi:hypothetical protein